MLRRFAVAAVAFGIAGACTSSPTSSRSDACPTNMPNNGDACILANPSSPPGAVGVCGYTTDTNECGAVNCYCMNNAWGCNPTCAILDASGVESGPKDAGMDVAPQDADAADAPADATTDGEAEGDAPDGPVGAVVLASGQNFPGGIAVDSTGVYWTTQDAVMAMPFGGVPRRLASYSPSSSTLVGIAVDGANVYWSDSRNVLAMPEDGGAPITLAQGPPLAQWVAIDATTVYYTADDSTGFVVASVPKAGGTSTTLVSGLVDAPFLTVDSTTVYWTGGNAATVMSVPKDGGAPTTLASGRNAVTLNIAVDSTRAYWNDLALMSVPLNGGVPVTLATSSLPDLEGIAVDSARVYFGATSRSSNPCKGALMAVPLSGGTPSTLAAGQEQPRVIALDATNIYWTDLMAGTVNMLPKP